MKSQERIGLYKGAGVWALYGEKNDVWYCVQVAKTKNVCKEVIADISRLNKEKNNFVGKDYINQFGEYLFSLDPYPSDMDQLYKHIADMYDDFVFINISAQNADLLKIESDFAWITKSEFWRNGGIFKKENLEQYKNYYADVCKKAGITDKMRNDIQIQVEEKICEFKRKDK